VDGERISTQRSGGAVDLELADDIGPRRGDRDQVGLHDVGRRQLHIDR
jgi:hypothetical protein